MPSASSSAPARPPAALAEPLPCRRGHGELWFAELPDELHPSTMAESSPAARADVASERDVLLATKLHVPGPRPGFVPRPRLADRLDEGLGRGLVLVCAPAGYGKTALLADWARRGQRPVAWLSLDAGDNDPARFWRHAVAALDRVCPGIGERVGPLLGPPPPPSFEGLVTALINELAAQPGAGEVAAGAGRLPSDRAPSRCTRRWGSCWSTGRQGCAWCWPAAPTRRWRWRGCGPAGSWPSCAPPSCGSPPSEAAALLRQLEAGRCGPARCGGGGAGGAHRGWAAGLQLAALSLRGQADVAGFVAAFTGSHRYVLDFLAEEVLERQSEQVRAFLLETSVLERLSGPLCDAVTGRTGSQALLEQVERAGLFLVPLDEVRGWWRYHHLFADLLRARLRAGTARPGGPSCTATLRPGMRSTGWPTMRSGTRWPPGR